MNRPNGPAVTDTARHARDELGAAWEHLLTAAEHSARQIGDTSRRRGTLARRRASAAAQALRGEQPSPWQWLAVGLAAGVAIGAAGAVALRHLPEREAARQRASEAVETVRQRAGEAAQTAATTAREKAHQVRERIGRQGNDTDESSHSGDQPARTDQAR